MRNQIVYFAVMLFVCIFVAFYSNAKICALEKNVIKIMANHESQKDSLIKITKVLMTDNQLHASKINNCIVRNTSTDEDVKLFDILGNHQTIIRLINTGCNPCNQDQIEMLKKLVDRDNLIILVNLTNMKLLRLFLNENNITSPVYWLKDTDILFQEDDNTKILVSYVNREGTILRVYHIDLNMLYIVQSLVH